MDAAPRVRVRSAADRARDQLGDLAVLNARLAGAGPAAPRRAAGEDAAAVRRRVDYLKRRRRSWELVTAYVTRQDALCTLAAIEDAARKVEAALAEGTRDTAGVGDLQRELEALQAEVAIASSRLSATQERVDANLARVEDLKREAERLEGTLGAGGEGAAEGAAAAAPAAPRRRRGAAGGPQEAVRRGLQSSMELEDGLKNQ
jgi:chlorophyllide a oxygenase